MGPASSRVTKQTFGAVALAPSLESATPDWCSSTNRICLCLKSVGIAFFFSEFYLLPLMIYERQCPEKHRISEIRVPFLTSKELDPSHSAPGPRRSSTSTRFHAPNRRTSPAAIQFFFCSYSSDIFHTSIVVPDPNTKASDAHSMRGFVP
ncbi:hypothetical protein EDB87DRAFT_595019 [Lactarius vividus]|nr:hypothetical protein EDB87DRAFT_595019 [Lactarius vividus]